MRDERREIFVTGLTLDKARLISAAPDLLAALASLLDKPVRYNDKRIEIDCDGRSDAMQRVRAARAALTKATGV